MTQCTFYAIIGTVETDLNDGRILMRHYLWPLAIWVLILVMLSGCAAVSHDMARKHADKLDEGVTVSGTRINIERTPDRTKIIVSSNSKKMAEAEIREGTHIRTLNDSSSFELLRIGSRPKTEGTTDVDRKGGINLFGKQTVAGLTVLNALLIIAAILIAPLIIGGLLSLHPVTAGFGLGILGIYRIFLPKKKPVEKTTVVESEVTEMGGTKTVTTETEKK